MEGNMCKVWEKQLDIITLMTTENSELISESEFG